MIRLEKLRLLRLVGLKGETVWRIQQLELVTAEQRLQTKGGDG
jgi:hypothetical protein